MAEEHWVDRINLEIVTPDRLLFSGDVNSVTVPGIEGYLGILPGHAPLLSELQVGVITFNKGTDEFHYFCGWGFVEVLPQRVSVLVESGGTPDQVDVAQARNECERANEVLHSDQPELDYEEAMGHLRQALAKLEAAERAGITV